MESEYEVTGGKYVKINGCMVLLVWVGDRLCVYEKPDGLLRFIR